MALPTQYRTTATVTDGLGTTARPVGRSKVETARRTKLGGGWPQTPAAHPGLQLNAVLVVLIGICDGRATPITIEWLVGG